MCLFIARVIFVDVVWLCDVVKSSFDQSSTERMRNVLHELSIAVHNTRHIIHITSSSNRASHAYKIYYEFSWRSLKVALDWQRQHYFNQFQNWINTYTQLLSIAGKGKLNLFGHSSTKCRIYESQMWLKCFDDYQSIYKQRGVRAVLSDVFTTFQFSSLIIVWSLHVEWLDLKIFICLRLAFKSHTIRQQFCRSEKKISLKCFSISSYGNKLWESRK